MGSGDGSGESSTAEIAERWAEPQYVSAKTSVWWDIENCPVPMGCDPHAIAQNISSALFKMNYSGAVTISAYGDTHRIPSYVQQALNSTGIALNHVPAGMKDASDKKILVGMLLWAVDNPAPANYLLISGDREFSDALHQLRMRRYNILLAQPEQASPALVAAAKSVWLWTSLLVGGSPLTNGESSQLASGNNMFNADMSPASIPNSVQPVNSNNETPFYRHQKFNKYKAIYIPKNSNQPIISSENSNQPSITSEPLEAEESKNGNHYNHPEPRKFKKAPHEFFISSEPTSKSSPNCFPSNPDPAGSKDSNQPSFPNYGFRPTSPSPNSSKFSNIPDIGKLSMSQYPNYTQNPPKQNGGEFKRHFMESSIPASYSNSQSVYHDKPYNRFPPRPSSAWIVNNMSGNSSTWVGTQGRSPPPPTPEYVQGLIGIVLLALSTLKLEKIAPNEANISDCIRFGDPKYHYTNVRQALDFAIDRNMVVEHKIGAVELYVGKMDKLWNCVNPLDGNTNQYPKEFWDRLEKYLSSSAGQSAIMASQCRYEAALILKRACLQEFTLGDVFRILNMIITSKRWIVHHHTGWQPVTITLAEYNTM